MTNTLKLNGVGKLNAIETKMTLGQRNMRGRFGGMASPRDGFQSSPTCTSGVSNRIHGPKKAPPEDLDEAREATKEQSRDQLWDHSTLDQFVYDLIGHNRNEFVAHRRIGFQHFHDFLLPG